ncbi:DUF1844 domain-containing protein [Candidatus Laterigemmans baculatus]|uniref:DUF1844 domain-containing protein n=1 Tax=Candidatus Laterigemmans baculatus TaxID=2770505 RepID=UPI0013DB28CB|nr:DUF1844 domain-containing protein [Candidatus Laterigemmans baculatus]
MSDADKDEPKLVVDEDWKESVQREKEQAAKQQQAAAAGSEAETAADETAAAAVPQAETAGESAGAAGGQAAAPAPEGAAGGGGELPPASFDFLVTTLATQAMMALGQFPGPDGKVGEVEKPIAKHYIDLLAVLEEKTKGNLDAGEQKLVSEVLHNLRMTFVAVK